MNSREFNWIPIIYLYVSYFGIILVGIIAHTSTTFIAAAIFLVLLFLLYWRYLLAVRMDKLLLYVAISMVIPVIPIISIDRTVFAETYQEIIKYYALLSVILIGVSLPLTPIGQSRRSWLLYVVILFFLVAGWLFPIGRDFYQGRVRGFMANPNNYALTAMMLLFLVDEERSHILIRRTNHVVVLFLTYLTRTAGAFIGYAVGLIYRYIFSRGRFSAGRLVGMTAAAMLVVIFFVAVPPDTVKPVDEVVKKLVVAKEHVPKIFSRERINFYEISQREKGNITSGLWRFYQWHRIMNYYLNSSIDRILFGFGIGTTDVFFKLKSHNDYLRLLFEVGVIGFFFHMAIWIIIYRRMDTKYRWIVIVIAVFCFTENNYDNFPAVSLLALYMIGSRKQSLSVAGSI